MAFIWVQVWGPVQTLNEVVMGDRPLGSQYAGATSNAVQMGGQDGVPASSPGSYDDVDGRKHGQYGTMTQTNHQAPYQYAHQQQPPTARTETFNMNSLGAALPEAPYQNYSPQRHPSASPSGPIYPMQNMQHFSPQNIVQPTHVAYNMPYQPQFQGVYGPSHSPSPPNLHSGALAASQFYPNQGYIGQQQQQQQLAQQYYLQANQYGTQNQIYPGMSSPIQYGTRNNNFPGESRYPAQQRPSDFLGVNSGGGDSGRQSSVGL